MNEALPQLLIFLFVVFIIAIFVFWIWMFVDMWKSRRIKKDTKVILTILFFVASFLTALIWLIFRRKI